LRLLIDLRAAQAFPNFSRPDEEQDRFARTVITVLRTLQSTALYGFLIATNKTPHSGYIFLRLVSYKKRR
jgi:hypothetical protein